MDCYTILKEVGDGTFGSVWRAINKQSGEVVAIKKLKRKYYSWEECMNLREVKSLRRMNHPNIVKLREVIRENDILYFVFEYMECSLYQLMKGRQNVFSEAEVRNWCFQIFRALAYMHERGYFHRDLKPENLLVTKDVLKIADFGLAREISSQPPYTEYVSTRWYRAPEVLLQASVYGSAVDMWAMGAIMAELFTLRPLFPGANEADEIYKICSVIGSPNQNSWAEGLQLANMIKYQFPQFTGVHLSLLIPSASVDAINLISSLCSWDPSKRPNASEVLHHSFFQPCFYIPLSPAHPRDMGMLYTPPSVGMKGALGQKSSRRYSFGTLSITNPVNNFAPGNMNSSIRTGLQGKFEVDYQSQEHEKIGRRAKNSTRQSQLPARNIPGYIGRNSHQVLDVTDELAHMTVSSNEVPNVAEKFADAKASYISHPMKPPPLKAGGWHNQTDFLGGLCEIPLARGYYRKVNG